MSGLAGLSAASSLCFDKENYQQNRELSEGDSRMKVEPMVEVTCTVNSKKVHKKIAPNLTLCDFLHDEMGTTGVRRDATQESAAHAQFY